MIEPLEIWEFADPGGYRYELVLQHGDLSLNSNDPEYPQRRAALPKRKKILALLHALVKSDGEVVERNNLENKVFGENAGAGALNSHLSWLRSLLGDPGEKWCMKKPSDGKIQFLPTVKHSSPVSTGSTPPIRLRTLNDIRQSPALGTGDLISVLDPHRLEIPFCGSRGST